MWEEGRKHLTLMWTRSKVDLISLRCDAGAGGVKDEEEGGSCEG